MKQDVVMITKQVFEEVIEDEICSVVSELFQSPAFMSMAFTQQLFQEVMHEQCMLVICRRMYIIYL